MPEADVQLIGVTKRFGSITAVDALDLEVYRGEFLSIIGPSGCGKTTTMRLVAGLDQPDAGHILIRGRRMEGVPPYRRNVGLVFQSFALFPHLNVLENVAFGLRMRKEPQERREGKSFKALRAVGMESLARRGVEQLSGGQKQRVALARALVVEPALILLDEPLGSLDAKLRIEMQSELKSLQRQMGITVINEGRFEQIGPPQAIYQQPHTRFVAEFVGRNNIFEGQVIQSRNGTVRVQTRHGAFAAASDDGVMVGHKASFVVRAYLFRPVATPSVNSAENTISGVIKGL